MGRMLKGSLKLIKDAKKRSKVVDEGNSPEVEEKKEENKAEEVEKEVEESEKEEEKLTSEDIAMDLNERESEDEERLLQKKVD